MVASATGFGTSSLPEPDMIPIGSIILWSGSTSTIPARFWLCNGTNGTVDLRDRFVICAGGEYDVHDDGGDDEHDHSITQNDHVHEPSNSVVAGSGAGSAWNSADNSTGAQADITIDETESLPPYYALAYIQRIS